MGGQVFEDYNYDGTKDAGETQGVAGIKVYIYDCTSNAPVDSTYTDNDGEYQFPASVATAGTDYRVEFSLPESVSCWAQPTKAGNNGGTTVQFVTAPGCAELGVANPADYCEEIPPYIIPCYINGDPLVTTGSNAPGINAGVVAILETETGTSINKTFTTPISETGTLWGIAVDQNRGVVYGSAFIRRHSGMGALGIGGIYVANYKAATPSFTSFLDIESIGIDVGSIGVNGAGGRELSADSKDPSLDLEAFAKVGKEGIGDIELSDDGNTLYIVNLFRREIAVIDLTNYHLTGAAVTAANVSTIALPAKSCTGGVARPFGLTIHENKLYAGLTCTAEITRDENNLNASVYSLDLNSTTAANWTEELFIPLDNTNFARNSDFVPWSDDESDYPQGDFISGMHQPLFSDFQFKNNGDMVFTILDRTGYQYATLNYHPRTPETTMTNVFPRGNLGIAGLQNGNYVLENNGSIPSGTGCNANSNEEWGGGSYYCDEGKEKNGIIGGIGYNPSTGRLIVAAEDPISFNSGGVFYFDDTDNGALSGAAEIFAGNFVTNLGKGAALGDIEFLCASAPIEIGNYVWEDTDNDGIQDACEPGIPAVPVALYDENCNLVATTLTDANGEYYFNSKNSTDPNLNWSSTSIDSLQANTGYKIVFGGTDWDTNNSNLTVNGTDYVMTTTNANSNNSDIVDSDISLGTMTCDMDAPSIMITTGDAGTVDHSNDAGFYLSCPTLTSIETQQSNVTVTEICNGESVDLKLTHGADIGDLAIYASSNATLTAADLYDFTNHGTNNITAVNAAVTPAAAATMTTETSVSPTATTTYYFILAQANSSIEDPDCLPMAITTVTVNPLPTADPAMMSVCEDGTGNGIFDLTTLETTIINGQSDVSVNWYSDAAGTMAITTPAAYTTADVTVYAEVEDDNTNCKSSLANINLIVNDINAATMTADQTVCFGTNPTAITFATTPSADGTVSYQWQSSTTDCASGFMNLSGNGANTDTYTPPATATAGNTYYQVVITSALNGVVCTKNSDCVTVEVIEATPTATFSSSTADVCSEDSPAVTGTEHVFDLNSLISSGTITGTWSTANVAASANLSGSEFTASTALEGQTITFTYTLDPIGAPCTANTYDVMLTVNDCYVSIGNLVWGDTDNDGLFNNGETGIDGVTVELYSLGADDIKGTVDDVLKGMQATASGGLYRFDLLPAGDYYVKLNGGIPAGLVSSTGEGANLNTGSGTYEAPTAESATDNNDNGSQMMTMIMSNVISLSTGGSPDTAVDGDDTNGNLTVDFGLTACATVANLAVDAGSSAHLCAPGSLTTALKATTTDWEGQTVAFSYSTTQLTDPYTETSTALSTATSTSGMATLANATFPDNTTAAPVTYYVYALLQGATDNCQDFAETTVVVHPPVEAGDASSGTVCNDSNEGMTLIDLNGLLSANATTGGTWTRATGTVGNFNAAMGNFDANGVTVGASPVIVTFTYTVTGDANAPSPCDTDSQTFTVTIANCCPVITMSMIDPVNGMLCSDETTFTVDIAHEANPGDLALYYSTGAGAAPANQVYDGTAVGLTLLEDEIMPANAATMTQVTGLTLPANTTAMPITYYVYARLEAGNASIDEDGTDG
ncbi:MAG: SdrD B-like domain-containing protein, partial [Saprospiraceae bacterium]